MINYLDLFRIQECSLKKSMKIRFESNSSNQGFSLIELIVVLIITAILAQLGFTAFNKYLRRTRALAAKTALLNIKKECESNNNLKVTEEFTQPVLNGYLLLSGEIGNCNGNNGLIIARPNNPDKLPEYQYNFSKRGDIECSQNSSDNFFKDCQTLKQKLESYKFVVKDSYKERGCSAYVVVSGPSWEKAEENSNKIGGHLVTINDKQENDWIASNIGSGLWIGMTDKNKEGVWEWSSGEEVTFKNWEGLNNHGGNQNYGWLHSSYPGQWDDNWNTDRLVSDGLAEIDNCK